MIVVSSGTLRPQDLIPAFLDAVREYAPVEYAGYALSSGVPAYAAEDDTAEWWNSEDAHYLLEELTELLEASAPDGTYFGAHPGDGACFGFWEE